MSTLLLVHAHPDDEAISTGGAMMKARADGHRVVLVTATRGEVGEIYNMDEKATRPHLGEVRTKELEKAVAYTDPNPCGCYFEFKATGTAPASCTTCTTTPECGDAGNMICSYGYCEAK